MVSKILVTSFLKMTALENPPQRNNSFYFLSSTLSTIIWKRIAPNSFYRSPITYLALQFDLFIPWNWYFPLIQATSWAVWIIYHFISEEIHHQSLKSKNKTSNSKIFIMKINLFSMVDTINVQFLFNESGVERLLRVKNEHIRSSAFHQARSWCVIAVKW